MKNVGIVGGGLVGLCTAYYLHRAGHQVTLLEQGDLQSGCSWGNAGMIVPSHIIPLAAPGMIAKGIRWMFNARSPFYVKPRLSGSLVKWGYLFYKHATREHVARAIPALRDISVLSKELYQDMAKTLPIEFGYAERGLLMTYQTAETEREEIEAAHVANANGIRAEVLSASEVQALEPDVRINVRGGVYFPGDAHLIPQQLVQQLAAYLRQHGVKILTHTPVEDFGIKNGRVDTVQTASGSHRFDEVVMATGAWSGLLATKLGLTLPVQGGKGYSFTVPNVPRNIQIPTLLLEARVAVTPMGADLRFGGTMEINGVDHSVNMTRVEGIVQAIPKYYPDLNIAMPPKETIWHGLRPCSPDGLPYIGRAKHLSNVIVATGHGMMGVSLAPATGHLVNNLIGNTTQPLGLSPFDPTRFD